ncbi:MAG: hypothetical protein LBH95_00495 [Oscillospiraceae bacterium]|jgi:hypothetical protein|nr:hypothetical protein [Oscillospiraceae bacterium]
MKKNDLYQAAHSIKPGEFLRERLEAKVINPPERVWPRVIGTLVAAITVRWVTKKNNRNQLRLL